MFDSLSRQCITQGKSMLKHLITSLLNLLIGLPLLATLLDGLFILLARLAGVDSHSGSLALSIVAILLAGLALGLMQSKLCPPPAHPVAFWGPVVVLLCASFIGELALLWMANAGFESDLFLRYYEVYPCFSLCLYPFEENSGDPVAMRALIPLMPAMGWLVFMLTIRWRTHRSLRYALALPMVLLLAVVIMLACQFYDRQQRLETEDPAVMLSFPVQERRYKPNNDRWQIHARWPRVGGNSLCDDFIAGLYSTDADYHNVYGDEQSAWQALLAGELDLVVVPPLNKAQREQAAARGMVLQTYPVARDALVFITHRDNPVSQLSQQQIQAIYAGEMVHWPVSNKTIRPYQKAEEEAAQQVMQSRVMQGKTMRRPLETMADEGIVNLVRRRAKYQNYPQSLGYFWRSDVLRADNVDWLKMLAVDGIQPDTQALCHRQYPFVEDVWLVTTATASRETKRLVEAILSAEGQKWIAGQGYIALAGCSH
ncbi:hypothetical protein E1B77_23425 [Salmonella enterica subsp. enterica]|nr:hypothetical protein [Salmonella enterica subsp. enterica]